MKRSETPLIALLLLSSGLVEVGCSSSGIKGEGPVGTSRATLRRVQSCSELEQGLKADALAKVNEQIDLSIEQAKQSGGIIYGGPGYSEDKAVDTAAPSAPEMNAAPAAGADRAASHSETNVQVKGVDEADIVKNDDKFLYLLHGNSFRMLNAWPAADMVEVGSATIEGEPTEMFVDSGKAVVYSLVDGTKVYEAAGLPARSDTQNGATYAKGIADGAYPGYIQYSLTKVTVLDLTGNGIRPVRELYYEGSYLSSRRVGSKVRTVFSGGSHPPYLATWPESNDGKYPTTSDEMVAALERVRTENIAKVAAAKLSDWLPYTMEKAGDKVNAVAVRCEDMYLPPSATTDYGFTQIATFDLDAPTQVARSTGILGAADTVYSDADTLVLAAHAWQHPSVSVLVARPVVSPDAPATSSPPVEAVKGASLKALATPVAEPKAPDAPVVASQTHLHEFDMNVDPDVAVYVASGTIDGSVKDQFSLDRSNGFLRATTTQDVYDPQGQTPSVRTSNVFVLAADNGELKEVGSVRGLATGESIFSTRFVGNRGYVVTFRQVDPLFVFDLSDPAKPTKLAERKIDGFSEYMHPLDENGTQLLTIGRDADPTTGRTRGLMLRIFDVTDANNPIPAHEFKYAADEYGYSEASYNAKAFTYFPDRKLLAFPYWAQDVQNATMRSSLEIFRIDRSAQVGIARLGSLDATAVESAHPNGYCGSYYTPQVRRGVFMEDVVYSISYGGVVAADVKTLGAPIKTLRLAAPQLPAYSAYPVCAID